MTTGPSLHHVVFAVAADRQAAMMPMFTELGFAFKAKELTELGVHVSSTGTRPRDHLVLGDV